MENAIFKQLDEQIQFHYKEDLMGAVKTQKTSFVSEFVHTHYYAKNQPVSAIAKALPITKSVIYFWMKRWGFERRPRGGNVKNRSLLEEKVIEKIKSYRGKCSTESAAFRCGCSVTTVRNIWNRIKEDWGE